MRIDRQLLVNHQACREGLDWFSTRFTTESTSFTDGLAALQRDGHPEFIAWAALHVPELRDLAPPELLAGILGPRWAELGALADRLSRFRWLAPTQDAADVAGLIEMHGERLAAQAGVPSGFNQVKIVPIEEAFAQVVAAVSQTWDAAQGDGPPAVSWALLWRRAYLAARSGGEAAAQTAVSRLLADAAATAAQVSPGMAQAEMALGVPPAPWFELRQRVIGDLSLQLRPIAQVAQQVCRTVDDLAFLRCYARTKRSLAAVSYGEDFTSAERVLIKLAGQHRPAAEAVVHGASTVAACARLDVGAAALWLLADVRAPNPFAPLLEVWRLGYWPAGAIDGTFLIGDPRSIE